MKINYVLKNFDPVKITEKYGLTEKGKAQLFLANNAFRRMEKSHIYNLTLGNNITLIKAVVYVEKDGIKR